MVYYDWELSMAAGAITGTTKRQFSFALNGDVRLDGADVYASSATGISKMNMATGVETQPIAAEGVTDFEVLADQVFYSTAGGVYQYDTASATTAPYVGPIVEPVTE